MMLTTQEIKGLKAKKSAYYVTDNTKERGKHGKGRLVVQVAPSGSKFFKFKYYTNGKPQFVMMGQFPALQLSQARKIYEKYSELVMQGKDVKAELERQHQERLREAQRLDSKGTIKELLKSHSEYKKRNGKRNYAKDLNMVEKELYIFIDPTTKAHNIRPKDLIPYFHSMIQRGASSTANKTRSILLSAFNYGFRHDNDPATYKENYEKKFDLVINPVQAIPKQTDADTVGNHVIDSGELFKLLYDMENRFADLNFHQTTRDIISLCFYLGGQRPFEVVNTKWSDINWKEKYITVREEVFKTNKIHLIPLTRSSLRILKRRKERACGSYVFYKKTNINSPTPTNTIAQAVKYYNEKTDVEHFTPRDFRRTFKTLGGKIGISKEYRDRIQGHAFNDVSSKHYDRYDYFKEKLSSLEAWEKYLNDGISEYKNSLRSTKTS